MFEDAREKIGSFIWGANGEQLTPEQVARKREMAAMAQGRAGDTSPVGHWTQGAARVVDALGGVMNDRRADRNEESGLASADEYVNSNPVLAGLLGGGGGSPTQMSSMSAPMDPATGLPASIVQSESGGNWNALNSEGYGGRGQFGEDRLADAARAGIIPAGMTGESYSRAPKAVQLAVENWHKADILGDLGQYVGVDVDGAGPIPPLTENSILSVAHLGGTGGARRFVESGGAYNPSDSNGTSLSDYATMHAGGSPTQMSTRGAPQPNGDVIAALSGAMANPWVAEKYGPVIEQLMGQEQRRGDMRYQQELKQSDPMYQAELAAMNAPPPAPGAPETKKIFDPATGREQVVQWNGSDWEPIGGVAAPSGPLVQNNIGGNEPGDYLYGTDAGLPNGYRLNTATGVAEFIPGGPEDPTLANENAAGNDRTATDLITTAAGFARDADGTRIATGILGTIASINPSSDNAEINRHLGVLRGIAKTSNLQAMREASKTGGALGSVSAPELTMLEEMSGALDPASPNFARDLDNYERTLLRTIHGPEAGDRIFEETRGDPPPQPSSLPTDAGIPDYSQMTVQDLNAIDIEGLSPAAMQALIDRYDELGQ